MKKSIIAAALAAIIGMGGSTIAFAADDAKLTPATRMASFEACMVKAGFQKDTDFRTRLVSRTIAGVETLSHFDTMVVGAIKRDDKLLAKYNSCRTANGLSEVTA